MNAQPFDPTVLDTASLRQWYHFAEERCKKAYADSEQASWDGDDAKAERCEAVAERYEQHIEAILDELDRRGESIYPGLKIEWVD